MSSISSFISLKFSGIQGKFSGVESSSYLSLCRESKGPGLNEPLHGARVNSAVIVGSELKWPGAGRTLLTSLCTDDLGIDEHPSAHLLVSFL